MSKIWCCGAPKSMSSLSKSDNIAKLPKGHIHVYVGKDDTLCKLEMEANYLNHPLFENLLRMSEEEFGYSYDGALRIACEIDLFRYLIHLFKTNNPSVHNMDLPDLISKFHGANNAAMQGRTRDSEAFHTKEADNSREVRFFHTALRKVVSCSRNHLKI